jgi:hypothetical protein
MILAMTSAAFPVVFITCLLAFFTDERALIASSLILLWFWVIAQPLEKLSLANLYSPNYRMLAVVGSWLAYFALRVLLQQTCGLQTVYTGTNYFRRHGNMHFLGMWTGLEGFWLIVALSILILIVKKKWTFLACYCLSMLVVVYVSLSVIDISRSMGYLLPCVFISLYLLAQVEATRAVRGWTALVAIVCLSPSYDVRGTLVITMQPLPVQIWRIVRMGFEWWK